MSDDVVQIRASKEYLERVFLRDADGYRLKLTWEDPGPEGFSGLVMERDMDDNLYEHWESESKRTIEAFGAVLESKEWLALEKLIGAGNAGAES